MKEEIVKRLKEIKQLKLLAKRLRMSADFFRRFVQRRPNYFFYSRKVALSRATRKPAAPIDVSLEKKIKDKAVKGLSYYKDVISYPLMLGKDKEYSGGIVDTKSNKLIEEAIHFRGYLSQDPPNIDDPEIYSEKSREIQHPVLFGGILYDNFGHFLLESLGRLWAYEFVRELDPYILFYEDMGQPSYLEKNNFVHQVFTGFGIPHNRILFLNYVTKIKHILIPVQKYGYEYCRHPDEVFLRFITNFKFPQLVPAGLENGSYVYVSRSKMPYGSGRPIGENLFDEFLRSNGYKIFHPENHTIFEQLTVYSAARKIIFCDGGALHGCILLPHLKADVAVVARRRDNKWNIKEILDQFIGYGKKVSWIDAVKTQYHFGTESWHAISVIDWRKVSVLLKEEGFVETIFESFNEVEYSQLVRSELFNHIQSISKNPVFLDFMLKQDEKGIFASSE